MATVIDFALREQLLERRERLETAAAYDGDEAQIRHLLEEVDADLIRACLGDLSDFCAATPRHDDLTVMALRRS